MQRFKDILCVAANESSAEAVVARAATLAQQNQARLTVAATVPELTRVPPLPREPALRRKVETALAEAANARLARLVEPHSANLSIDTVLLADTPFLAVIRKVLQDGHDLVVKGAENPRWTDGLLGSDDMHLMRKCPCPVWVHRPGRSNGYRRILAAIDCETADGLRQGDHHPRTALNRLVFELASSMALAEGAELHLVHAWEAVGESMLRSGFATLPEDKISEYVDEVMRQNQAAADSFMRKMQQLLGHGTLEFLAPVTHLVKGWARDIIPETAEQIDADLVVMGTVGRIGVPGLFIGNTAETVLERLDCSILAVKPPGFETPVAAPRG